MASTDCIYRRTVAGQSAWDSGAPLAAPLLRVLSLVEAEMHSHILRRLLRHHAESAVADGKREVGAKDFEKLLRGSLQALSSPNSRAARG